MLRITGGESADTLWRKLRAICSRRPVIFVDGDTTHLKWVPLVLVRALLGGASVFISTATERLLAPGLKSAVRRALFRLLVLTSSRNRTVSIHRLCPRPEFDPYITDYIVDFQYWDLPYFSVTPRPLPELAETPRGKPVLVLIGALTEKKSKSELLELVADYPGEWPFKLVVAGTMDLADEARLTGHHDVVTVNRYLDAAEVVWLYRMAAVIYSYYDAGVRRPSGIFGRAVQSGRNVLVRRGGYLEASLPDYPGLIAIDSLATLVRLDWEGLPNGHTPPNLDDRAAFLSILKRVEGRRN